jgi:tRNA-2-methylthio-N6-dimethylallyladenosine synthase
MRPRVFLETFGCQMNVLDSQLVLGQLRTHGCELTDQRDSADAVVYNTCSVREHAEQKVWSRLGELRAIKRRRPGMVIAVIGCMAQREGTRFFRKYPHIDILCGPAQLDQFPAMLHSALTARLAGGALPIRHPQSATPSRQVALMGPDVRRPSTLGAAEDRLEMLDLSRSISPADDAHQAYVRITRGCDKFCSYCVVPYTRGPEVHRPPDHIIDEARRLADAGAMEVTLLGQTVNHYAYAHGDGRVTTFAQLLWQVHEAVPHLARLRFVTSFPRDFGDDALAAMRDCRRICRYLHVPAQSGSDRILKLMNRGYTVGQYLDLIDRARAMMADICIASDFIVGFPGETDEEHQRSLDLIRRCRFKNSFIFKYSPRPGTAADRRLADDVPDEVKRARNNEMLAVQGEVSLANARAMIGQTVQVLVEGHSKLVERPADNGDGLVQLSISAAPGAAPAHPPAPGPQLVGRTRGDHVVVFDGDPSLKGRLVDVKIVDAQAMTLFAQVAL